MMAAAVPMALVSTVFFRLAITALITACKTGAFDLSSVTTGFQENEVTAADELLRYCRAKLMDLSPNDAANVSHCSPPRMTIVGHYPCVIGGFVVPSGHDQSLILALYTESLHFALGIGHSYLQKTETAYHTTI